MEMKICPGCGKELPATTEYFTVDKKTKSGLRPRCKECDRQYRLENKDRIKKYYEENKEALVEYSRKYREENRGRIKKHKRKYCEKNKERMKKYNRKHREENKEYYRSYMQRRRSLKNTLVSTLTINQWQHAQSYFNHGCAYCGSATTLEQDHFWPLSRGGGYTVTNIIPACRSCNSSKHNKLFEEWYPTHESYSPEREAKIYEYFEQLALEKGKITKRRMK